VQAMPVQLGIIVGGPAVMAGRGDQVETPTVATPVVGTLETAKEKTLEQGGMVHRLPHG